MKIIEFPKKNEYSNKNKIFVLGKFGSFHKGHQKLLQKAKIIADQNKLELAIMIFDDQNEKKLYSFKEKKDLLKKYNIDYIMLFEPNKQNFS